MSNNEVLAVANHEIEAVRDGKFKSISAGTVFPIDSANFKSLEKLKAVREPSEAEVALYEKTQPKAGVTAKAESTAVKTTKGKKGTATEGEGAGAGEGAGNSDIV